MQELFHQQYVGNKQQLEMGWNGVRPREKIRWICPLLALKQKPWNVPSRRNETKTLYFLVANMEVGIFRW